MNEELATIARQGDDFRRITAPKPDDQLYGLSTLLGSFEIGTAYPLLLTLLDAGLGAKSWAAVARDLESYLVRRAFCNLTTKNYNRVFLTLTRNLRRDGVTAET